jgi:hypothetical protein
MPDFSIRSKKPGDRACVDPRVRHVVLDADGAEVGTIAKEPIFQRKGIVQGGGYSVFVMQQEHALTDDAGGEVWVPDFKTAKVLVERYFATPWTFRAPDPRADFDLEALFSA